MAMTLDTAIKFTAKLEGQGLDQLKRNLQGLVQQSNASKRSLDQLYSATKQLGAAAGNTIAGMRGQIAALTQLRERAEIGSRKFRILTNDIEQLEKSLRKLDTAGSGQGGLQGISGRGIGAALAGITTYFSGQKAVELAGTAASFGALQGQLLELNKAAGMTAATAQILAQDGLGAVIASSRASGVPIETLSNQLLKLTAASQGTIFQGAELNKVFIAINRYAAAFGVSVEDTDGIIRAFQQTLSKQKLSLEEINGQFGDRAPTALRVFANAARMSVPEFTKAVADGKLTVNDLVDLLPALTQQTQILEQTMSPLKKAQKDLNAEMAQAGLIIGRTLEPAVLSITKTLAGFLKSFNEGNTALAKGMVIAAGAIGGVAVAWLAVTAAARTAAIAQAAAASAAQAIKTGKGIAGLVAGGVLAVGGGLLANELFKGLDAEVAKARKELDKIGNLDLKKDFGQGALPPALPDSAAQTKEQKQQLQDRTELNRLLQEQLKLNYEAGVIGKSNLEKLDAELDLAKQLTRLRINEANLTSSNEKIRQQRIVNATAEFLKEKARIDQERSDTLLQIKDLGREADVLINKFTQRADRTESPLTRELQNVDSAIQDAAKNADVLLDKLNKLGGASPETGKLRGQLGNFKADQVGISPEERLRRASANLVSGDISNLQSEITALREYGGELSTIDQIKQRYLQDWDKLDPMLKQQLQTLARQRDVLVQNKQIADGVAGSIGTGIGSALDLVIKGTENWGNELRDIAANVLRDIANQLLQIMVIQPIVKGISQGIQGLLPSANGNVFDPQGLVPYAMGGIVDSPTLFKFANGGAGRLGLMGEAGPEAILPLRRGADGKLGVAGGGGTSVTVNVDAKGTSAQGDGGRGEQLARVVAQAVQAELIKQKRPGGLIAA